ncbi:MAG: glucose-1-phosphate adenylyltransferase subunit GlgD [Lachnospiraceae bacterium]|nr:glucose-1-phosphate adenylyltransferase subunit GlgD [Lachnospiraceae bacterium]
MKDTLGLIFAYQNEESMQSLTKVRASSSVPYGGRYRIVDFVLSNMVNSGITKVGVITRNNFQSLMDHLGSGKEWDLSRKNGGLYILPPFSQSTGYRGKMEALKNAESFIRKSTEEYVVLATANAITNQTYDEALAYHKEKQADITIIYKKSQVKKYEDGATIGNIITLDADNRVVDVAINPEVGDAEVCRSTEQIIIRRSLLETLIADCASHYMYSFHKDVLQRHLKDLKIYGFATDKYIAKVDSIATYYDASMDLLSGETRAELFYQPNQVFTKIRDEAPTLYLGDSEVSNSMIADGCIIEGTVENSIIFRGVHIHKGAVVKNSIIMQDADIQANAELAYAILDKDVVIREGRKLYGWERTPYVVAKGQVI